MLGRGWRGRRLPGPPATTTAACRTRSCYAPPESAGPAGQPPSHRRLKYGRAVTAGGAAFLYFNQNPGGLAVTGSLATRKPAPIPGLGLAYEDGATLLRLLANGPVRVRLNVTAAFPEVESANVIGDLPADPASPHGDELVLAGAHYDSHDIAPGALDNGTGVAIILEAARALAAAYRAAGHAPRRRLRFCLFAAEEIGLLGSWSYVSRHAAELPQLCFMLNVDDIGRSDPGAEFAPPGRLSRSGSPFRGAGPGDALPPDRP